MFVRSANPIWFFNNLTGSPVDPTYYIFFLQNELPYNFQNVYEDPNGDGAWNQPIEFQPSAGLPNNIYFDPTKTYRIQVRQGNLQTSPLIYDVQNYTIGEDSQFQPLILTASNMITNPQFSDVYFNNSVTFSTAGTYNIAPGWSLVLTGAGTCTVTQSSDAGDNNAAGNPPYYLTFNSAGWTSVQLVQTFSNNGSIFAGGIAAGALTAFATGSVQTLTMSYIPSNLPNSSTQLLSYPVQTGSFQAFQSTPMVRIPASNNTDTGLTASVSISINIPGTSNVSITNIQFVGQTANVSDEVLNNTSAPLFQEQTYERTIDQEFNVYKDSIVTLPKSTLLTGWNFGLNPFQFWPTAPTNVAGNQYTADQTIIIQQKYVASATGNNVSLGRGSFVNQKGGLAVTAVTAHNQFAILQYVDAKTMAPYWSNFVSSLSSMLNVYVSSIASTVVKFKMRLIYTSSAPSTTSQVYPIASWSEGSDPVFAAGVTAIIPEYDPEYTYGSDGGGFNNFPFNNISIPESPGENAVLGILVYTTTNMNQAIGDYLVFGDVSLVPNKFAIASNPQTYDQVLKQCQYYFCKTFPQGTVPDENTPAGNPGALLYQSFIAAANSGGYYWEFPSIMRSASPTMHYYSPTLVTSNKWYNSTLAAASGTASTDVISDRAVFVGNPQVAGDNVGNLIGVHATADARLGI